VIQQPDPDRLGGLAWTRRTHGELTAAERRRLIGEVVRTQASYIAGRVKLLTGYLPPGARDLSAAGLRPPDSAFARAVEEACAEQPASVAGHGHRSWMFGSALAALDQVELEPEAFYGSALLHDYGIAQPVAGEDFTLRSAARLERCADQVGLPETVKERAADAITVHATPGISVASDGALGTYVQAGAMFDLGGLRAADLTREFRDAVARRHPRAGVSVAVIDLIRAEARANPGGRFGLLHRCGLTLVVRLNPLRPR
jgi:hypothetical protein